MPSGAKKRKAAKKKAQKQAHNTDGSHLQGIDETKSHDERESDGGEGERESSEERGVSRKNEEGEQNVAEFSKEAKLKENYDDDDEVRVNVEDDVRGTKNGKHKSSSSSSSGSSSDDDEIAVEKEKTVVSEVQSSLPEASRENPVISEAVYGSVEESIPIEESVKQVVSSPQEVKAGSESADVEDPVITHVIESEKKQNLDEVLLSAGEKQTVSPRVTEFLQEKIENKIIQAQEEGPRNQSESADITARNGEGLPQSSGVTSADACFEDNHVKESETQKYVEDQPLAPSVPLPVRRTSLMNCCGLLEVFSGGASR